MTIIIDSSGAIKKVSQSHGYVSNAWQKDPLRLGWSERVAVTGTIVAVSTSQTVVTAAVPAGEIHRVHAISARDESNAVTTGVDMGVTCAGIYVAVRDRTGALAWYEYAGISCDITLKEGDTVSAILRGCQVGDTCRVSYIATRIDIDQ